MECVLCGKDTCTYCSGGWVQILVHVGREHEGHTPATKGDGLCSSCMKLARAHMDNDPIVVGRELGVLAASLHTDFLSTLRAWCAQQALTLRTDATKAP